jgi:hypothetical protein
MTPSGALANLELVSALPAACSPYFFTERSARLFKAAFRL